MDLRLVGAWIGFLVLACISSLIDVACIGHRLSFAGSTELDAEAANDPQQVRNKRTIALQIGFWLLNSLIFAAFVWLLLGADVAGAWSYGYFLEYLLSVDNLFVFRMIFQAYSAPAKQVGRALFWGVAFAVVLRLIFFVVGTELFTLGLIPRLLFAAALIYSGIKTVRSSGDDDDDDPKQNKCVRIITMFVPLYDGYAEEPRFFLRVSEPVQLPEKNTDEGCASAPSRTLGAEVIGKSSAKDVLRSYGAKANKSSTEVERTSMLEDHNVQHGAAPEESPEQGDEGDLADIGLDSDVETNEQEQVAEVTGPRRCKATLLFIVVISLAIIDVVFAVDSVTAKMSSMKFGTELNLFVNITSSAFAMFVLRSLYCLLDAFIHMFRFLNYGVGTVLILIGLELVAAQFFGDFGMVGPAALIVGILLLSVVLSVALPKRPEVETDAGNEDPEEK